MADLNPHQFGEQMPLFDSTRMRFPYAPATHNPVETPRDSMNKHGVFLRFGDWPESERSMNHAFGGTEEGVSVYNVGNRLAEPEDPDPHGSRYDYDLQGAREFHADQGGTDEDFNPEDWSDMLRGNDTGEEMMGRRNRAFRDATYDGKSFYHPDEQKPAFRGHFVTGRVVGFGHDDEPLLNGVRKVGSWPQDSHRFVSGEDQPLWTKWNRNIGGDV